jgi:hypothetical protein
MGDYVLNRIGICQRALAESQRALAEIQTFFQPMQSRRNNRRQRKIRRNGVNMSRRNNAARAIAFSLWTHKGKTYFKNPRGNVVSEDFDWVGRYNNATGNIDETVPEPANLGNARLAE